MLERSSAHTSDILGGGRLSASLSVAQCAMPDASRGPSYSTTVDADLAPAGNILIVGKPLICAVEWKRRVNMCYRLVDENAPAHFVALGEHLVRGGVHGGHLHLPLERGGRARPLGRQRLAVAAPARSVQHTI